MKQFKILGLQFIKHNQGLFIGTIKNGIRIANKRLYIYKDCGFTELRVL
jgi:hypothetical protein